MGLFLRNIAIATLALGVPTTAALAQPDRLAPQPARTSYVAVEPGIKLRRVVFQNPRAKGRILLLHGFPETTVTWQAVASKLSVKYEVHSFDWPGFGKSSRPATAKFAYAPSDYARVLRAYIRKARIGGQNLTIYATDIGGLPALLAAIDRPDIAGHIIVGDFAPFDRPQFMAERLQALKTPASAVAVRAAYNAARDEVLVNAFRRGLSPEAQFAISPEFQRDMAENWKRGELTTADAFAEYYASFTRDQNRLESNLSHLKTPVTVVWGEKDIYIDKRMGEEFAIRAKADFLLLPGIGHYPHLQEPELVASEIEAIARTANVKSRPR